MGIDRSYWVYILASDVGGTPLHRRYKRSRPPCPRTSAPKSRAPARRPRQD